MLSWVSSLSTLVTKAPSLSTPLIVVIGNVACDLDSGVSSLVLASHLAKSQEFPVLPVMNILKQDFPLKTELVYVLEKEGIKEDNLVFRDSLDLHSIKDLRLILVDHNILSDEDKDLDDMVVEVIDHHVKETGHKNATIEMVGSCSSLILRKILSENASFNDQICIRLILQTILLDTVKLDPSAKRATAVDIEMVEQCERILGPQDRQKLFADVMKEKTRVSHLTAGQLCRRDLKIIRKEDMIVALSSVPMLASSWINLANVEDEVKQFMSSGDYAVVLILGISIDDDTVTRDLLIVGDKMSSGFQKINSALVESTNPNLDLEVSTSANGFLLYKQHNHSASRKQILPLVKQSL